VAFFLPRWYDEFYFLHTFMVRIAFFVALMAVTAPALAHDFWLEREGDAFVALQGHRHSSHGGTETIAYDPAKVGPAWCAGDDGAWKALSYARSQPVKLSGACLALALSYTSGYWSKTPWGTRNEPKTGLSGVLKSWHSEETVTRILRWSPALAKPRGKGLEMVPSRDPLTLKSGDKLIVQVFDDGKPVAGVPVAYGDDTRGTTAEDGRIAIRLRHGGMQLLAASRETPLTDGKADVAVRTAALQFEIAP